MTITTGRFTNPETHHTGWFRVFRSTNWHIFEFWFGERWIMITRGK